MRLADALADLMGADTAAPYVRLRTGTITATGGAVVSVDLAGATVDDIPRLASYTPTVGDVTLLLQAGPQLIAIGRAA
jgi:hypothetical protein